MRPDSTGVGVESPGPPARYGTAAAACTEPTPVHRRPPVADKLPTNAAGEAVTEKARTGRRLAFADTERDEVGCWGARRNGCTGTPKPQVAGSSPAAPAKF